MSEKAQLVAKRGEQDKAAKDAQTTLDAFVKERLPALGSADMECLLHSTQGMDVKLKQINVYPPGTQINYVRAAGLAAPWQSCPASNPPPLVPPIETLPKT